MMQATAWIALTGDAPEAVAGTQPLRTGALSVALRGIPRVATVLADARVLHQGRALSAALIAGQDVGVVLRLRGAGGQVLRHVLAAELYSHPGSAELTFSFIGGGDEAPAGRWRLSLCNASGRLLAPVAIGAGALAMPPALGAALVAALGDCRFVQTAGLRRAAPGRPGPEQIGRGAAIAGNSFLQTPGGLVPAAALMAGDAVLDISGRELRLAEMQLAEVPAGFAFSPLRVPGAEGRDLLIGPRAQLSMAGGLVTAAALSEARRFTGPSRVALMAVPVTDRPALLLVGGYRLAAADPEGRLPQPVADLTGCRRAV